MVRLAPNQWPADGSLPPLLQEFVAWVIHPERDPKTVAEWADTHDITRQSMYRWRKDKRVKDAIEKQAAEYNVDPESTQEIINSVRKAAKAGDMKAAALYLQYIDKLTPKRVVIQDERIEKLSDEELREEMVSLGLMPSVDDADVQYESARRPVSFATEGD